MPSGSNVLNRLDALSIEGIGSQGASSDKQWIELVQRAARSKCTILITGETGVGKEYLARWVHSHSTRRERPFVPVNCGAIPETIVDSQLFGHVRGSFTGATFDHLGLVRAAEGGTLFLDEVGELPTSSQTRLLRLLQEREVQPVGRAGPIIVDVRVIAASNRDLVQAVETSQFRQDLLFRLDVVQLRVKPLRERPAHVSPLLDTFNREFADQYDQPELDVDAGAMNVLMRYPWPGNVRQLRSLVERLHVLSPGRNVTVDHLLEFGQLRDLPSVPAPTHSMHRVKAEVVASVLPRLGVQRPNARCVPARSDRRGRGRRIVAAFLVETDRAGRETRLSSVSIRSLDCTNGQKHARSRTRTNHRIIGTALCRGTT